MHTLGWTACHRTGGRAVYLGPLKSCVTLFSFKDQLSFPSTSPNRKSSAVSVCVAVSINLLDSRPFSRSPSAWVHISSSQQMQRSSVWSLCLCLALRSPPHPHPPPHPTPAHCHTATQVIDLKYETDHGLPEIDEWLPIIHKMQSRLLGGHRKPLMTWPVHSSPAVAEATPLPAIYASLFQTLVVSRVYAAVLYIFALVYSFFSPLKYFSPLL